MTTINLAESQNLPFACLPRLYFLLFAIVALHLSRVLYKSTLFMQNKPNFQNAKMNTTACITRPYEVLTPRPRRGYKPNQTQFQKADTKPHVLPTLPKLPIPACPQGELLRTHKPGSNNFVSPTRYPPNAIRYPQLVTHNSRIF